MLYNPDIILIDNDIIKTLKKLRKLKPDINWQVGYSEHDLGSFSWIAVDDEDEGFDEDRINEICKRFNDRDFDSIKYL